MPEKTKSVKSGFAGKAGDFLKKFDNYGETASFQIKGKATSNTICGSIVSIAVLCLTLSYAYKRFQIMQSFADSAHKQVFDPYKNQLLRLSQAESGFNFAMGIINSETF